MAGASTRYETRSVTKRKQLQLDTDAGPVTRSTMAGASTYHEMRSVIKRIKLRPDNDVGPVTRVTDSDPQLPSGGKDLFDEILIYSEYTSTPVTYKRRRSTRKKKGSRAVKLAIRKRRALTGVNACSGDISVVSANGADVSEIRPVQTQQGGARAKSSTVPTNSGTSSLASANSADVGGIQVPVETVPCAPSTSRVKNYQFIVRPNVFKGVVVFVDYNSAHIKLHLKACGATVAKTFNKKVQYVIFSQGHRTTYNLAIKRKIPLVGMHWVQECYESNKLVNPDNYPAADLEDYANYKNNALLRKLKNNKRTRMDIISDSDKLEFIVLKTCVMDKEMNELQNSLQHVLYEWGELRKPIQNLDEGRALQKCETIDSIKEQLIKILNAEDYCQMSEDQINKLPIPEAIGRLYQFLTPKGNKKTTMDINVDLTLIEDYLGLNDQCRQRLKKLIFSPHNNKLHFNSPKKMVKKRKIQPYYNNDCTPPRKRPFKRITKERYVSISSAGMNKKEVGVIKYYIQNIGTFSYCPRVTSTTKYLIMKSLNYKPLNVMFALARGCHIISENWVHDSNTVGYWLSPEPYLISGLSPGIQRFYDFRDCFNIYSSKFNIFEEVGFIYISDKCKPSKRSLELLVEIGRGVCTLMESAAKVVIGRTSLMKNNLNENWVLDSIIQGSLQDKSRYMIVNNN